MAQPAFRTEHAAVENVPQASTLRIQGRVTLDEAPELRREILGLLARTGSSKLVLELSGVSEMDTSGTAVLAEAVRRGQDRGMRILLCSPSESVMRIFRLAGFDEVLAQCCPNPAETLRRLRA